MQALNRTGASATSSPSIHTWMQPFLATASSWAARLASATRVLSPVIPSSSQSRLRLCHECGHDDKGWQRHFACHCGRRSFNCWRQYCNVRTPGFGSWGVHKRRYSRKILDIDLQTTDVLGRKEATWSRPCAPLKRRALRQPPARTRPARRPATK